MTSAMGGVATHNAYHASPTVEGTEAVVAVTAYEPEVLPSHAAVRPLEHRASRSGSRRTPLTRLAKPTDIQPQTATGAYWFGKAANFEELDTEGKHNARLAYALAEKQPWFSTRQVGCLDDMWFHESSWKTGDGGIPQAKPESKMAAFGDDWLTNPRTQILWGFDYITHQRKDYGDPCTAWGLWQSRDPHWY